MLIIDGDLYVYKAGFANRKNELGHKIINRVTNEEIDYGFCSYSSVIVKLKEDNINHEEWKLTPYFIPGPIEFAIGNVKRSLSMLLERFNTEHYELYLTSTDHSNYRYQIATTQPYKGSRQRCKQCFEKVTSEFNKEKIVELSCKYHGILTREQTIADRPYYFNEIREYLIDKWDAMVISGQEADDIVSIRGGEVANSIMVHIDKDINNTPGQHYNPDTDIEYIVTEEEATRNFYTQFLLGDNVDNIPGVRGCGKKVAEELLKDCLSPEEYEERIIAVYQGEHFNVPRFRASHNMDLTKEEAYNRLKEVGQLLWIRREYNEFWQPKIKIE